MIICQIESKEPKPVHPIAIGCQFFFGVSQGSILAKLLFSIFLADLFFIVDATDVVSYAGNSTPYASDNDIDEFIKSLKEATSTLFKWFSDNLKKEK